jgi:hypothetical protein
MSGRDLHGGGQVLEAIRLDGPRRVIGEDVADPGLLGTGEHGAAMVAERTEVGQPPPSSVPSLRRDLYKIGNLRFTCGRRPASGCGSRGRPSQAGQRWSRSVQHHRFGYLLEQCREEAHYLGATLTELNSDGSYRWTGNDRAANERLKKCMAARGRHIYGY